MKEDSELALIHQGQEYFRHVQLAVGDIDNLLANQVFVEYPSPVFDFLNSKVNLFEALIRNMRQHQLRVIYPNIIWSSLFLSSYGGFEALLDALSDYQAETKHLSLKPSDLKQKGLRRSEKYLSCVANLTFPPEVSTWNRILETEHVRNCLIHANGVVSQTSKRETLIQYAKQNKDLIEIKNDRLTIKKNLPSVFSKWCDDFCNSLLN